MSGNVTIEYDACVAVEGKPGDRLSDLNCFWMASDPKASDIWKRMNWRNGVFVNCYSLQACIIWDMEVTTILPLVSAVMTAMKPR